MSKVILILDEMPENCPGCPCEYDCIKCTATDKSLIYVDFSERPDWCELRFLPEKLFPMPANHKDLEYAYYCNGWNDCLDAITKYKGRNDL